MLEALPGAAELGRLLTAEADWAQVGDVLERVLVAPARDLLSRPSKGFRARLVALAYQVATRGRPADADAEALLQRCGEAIELLHAGSLIVDDVQDGSPVRRGDVAVHARYGVGAALCTGNWLYFWPLRILSRAGFSAEAEREALRVYHEAVEKAHYGQALDLNLKVDAFSQAELPAVCRAVLELKAGALTALAVALGALAAGADARGIAVMQAFGRSFGCALQQLDDIGNLAGTVDPEKRFEDMLLRKPTGVWGFAARSLAADAFERFRLAAFALPEGAEDFVGTLRAEGFFVRAAQDARRELDAAFEALASHWELAADAAPLAGLRALVEKLAHAYD